MDLHECNFKSAIQEVFLAKGQLAGKIVLNSL